MNPDQLKEIIRLHGMWLRDETGGVHANLQSANLRDANLRDANLQGADLQSAYLQSANLQSADLRDANLRDANLQSANLQFAKELNAFTAARLSITPQGALIGWKKCRRGVIVKLYVPTTARRCNATGRKCRAEWVLVMEVNGATEGVSMHDPGVVYRVGETVRCHEWGEDRWQECAGGIHFFLTREEAEDYQ